jgi:hypothetical protein
MSRKPHTHVLWIQRWKGGKFVEWHAVGRGWVENGPHGVMVAHNFQHLAVIGPWNGYSCLLPTGMKPPLPPPPKRSQAEDDDEEEGSLGTSGYSPEGGNA